MYPRTSCLQAFAFDCFILVPGGSRGLQSTLQSPTKGFDGMDESCSTNGVAQVYVTKNSFAQSTFSVWVSPTLHRSAHRVEIKEVLGLVWDKTCSILFILSLRIKLRFSNYGSATTAQQLRLSNHGSATTAQQPRLSNHGSATKLGSRFSNYASATTLQQPKLTLASATTAQQPKSTLASATKPQQPKPTPSGKYMHSLILHVISKSHPLWQVHAQSHLTRHIKIPPPLASTCTVSSYT